MSFENLGLSAELLRALDEQAYREPTPVQRKAIPPALAGRDVLAAARTGTGKTAAFALPLLHRLQRTAGVAGRRRVRALVLVPTRELCAQVHRSIRGYGRHLPLTATEVFGGVGIGPQVQRLRRGVDIVVATPGRLLDHLDRGTVELGTVEALVLDEADRMLDMGFIHDLRRVLAALPRQRQRLLFSATFPARIRTLAAQMLHDPAQVQADSPNTTAERVRQHVHPVDRDRKRALLVHRIREGDWRQVLVFTRTKHAANRLAGQLARAGITAAAIHGNKSQGARTRALADFRGGRVRVLVATDLAARGLDIAQLPHVVNYELPNAAEDYVHRIGRTARAGESGEAISLVCVDEQHLLGDIERLLGRRLDSAPVPGFEPDPQARPRPIASGRARAGGSPRGDGRRPAAPRGSRRPGGGRGAQRRV